MKHKNCSWGILCAIFSGLLWNCSSGSHPLTQSEQGGEEIILEAVASEPLYSQIDSLWHIPLETTDSSLLSSIAEMEVMEDRYYILNGTYTSILIFDRQGKFIRGIYDQGKGPKEYVRIGNMKLDRVNKQIVLSDQFSKKLLIYDRDGRWVRTIPFKHCWASIAPFIGDQYIQVNDGRENVLPEELKNWNLTVFDNTGKLRVNLFSDQTPNTIDFYTGKNSACLEDGDVLFAPILSSVIYQITEDSIMPRYRFVNKLNDKKQLSEIDKQQISYTFADKESSWAEYEKKGYLCSPGWFLNSDELLFAVFGQFAYKYFLFYNKRTQQVQIFDGMIPTQVDLTQITDDEALKQVFANIPLCIEKETVYTEFDHIHKLFLQGRDIDPRFGALCEALGDDDNPLLVAYTLKTDNSTKNLVNQ